MKIHKLDKVLIGKIAAGEVVEKPSSIVKELVENSIDANASIITVDVMDGGITSIVVKDNGDGMDPEDALLSLERHATSKIKTANDLFSISSLGFRGEALSSIAAVSKLKLKTNTKNSSQGTLITSIAGKIVNKEQKVCPVGTEIIVEDLFFNTPARKKFLKSAKTEINAVIDIVMNYALVNPKIHFKLTNNGKILINSPSASAHSNIVSILGRNLATDLIPINYSQNNIEINGFISKPNNTRSDKKYQRVFINNRYIKNKLITNAIYEGYHTMLNVGRHPIVVLNITIDPTTVDVNVHPAKTEIKLEDESLIFNVVSKGVKSAIITKNIIPEVVSTDIKKQPQSNLEIPENIVKSKQTFLETPELKTIEKNPAFQFNIIGKVHDTYVIAEDKDGLVIIDQHALHERVQYERYMKQLMDKKVEIQELLDPETIELSPKDANLLENNQKLLEEYGFITEPFGKNTFVVRTIPKILGRQYDDKIIFDIIDELENNKVKTIDKIKEKIITRIACRSAIKAHDDVQITTLFSILSDIGKTEIPYTCPHGRPTLIRFSIRELEKKFKRIM